MRLPRPGLEILREMDSEDSASELTGAITEPPPTVAMPEPPCKDQLTTSPPPVEDCAPAAPWKELTVPCNAAAAGSDAPVDRSDHDDPADFSKAPTKHSDTSADQSEAPADNNGTPTNNSDAPTGHSNAPADTRDAPTESSDALTDPGDTPEDLCDDPEGDEDCSSSRSSSTSNATHLGSDVHQDKLEMLRKETQAVQEVRKKRKARISKRKLVVPIESEVDRLFPREIPVVPKVEKLELTSLDDEQ